MPFESGMYVRWYADNICLFVPIQQKVKEFLATTPQYPFQEGSSLNAANIRTLKAAEALKRLQEIESIGNPNN
jgi:arylsulfatase